jgi:putative tricarboxylic transport membrane protein
MFKVRPAFNIGSGKLEIDLPLLALATMIAGWAAWYCWDAWHASSDVENMILILPVSAAAILLYIFVVVGCCKRIRSSEEQSAVLTSSAEKKTALRIAGSMVLLAGFVVAGPLIGFDIATFVFTLSMMAFLGERRILFLLFGPLLFTAGVIYCFSTLLATPLPVFFVWGHNS